MNHGDDSLSDYRPADVCRALLAALDAAEGRRRRRKRDQTPDAFGLAIKRDLLQRAVADDPSPDAFEEWLLNYPTTCEAPELVGPAFAMARAVFEEWRLAHSLGAFREWLAQGAPSEDANPQSKTQEAAAPQLSAIVLAGGRSSRMGTPKALLPFGGEPLIAHIVRKLQALSSDVVVVASPDQDLPDLPVTLVRDDVAYQGPVGGLCYGLRHARGDLCFVTSCDVPFLNMDLVQHLVAAADAHDVAVPLWQGRLQPLHAVYRRQVLPLLEAQLARGELRPVALFDKVRTHRVEEDEIRRVDPDGWSFFNMNAPEEYEEALRRWDEITRPAANQDPATVRCTVELFGVARLVANTSEVPLAIPEGATLAQVLTALSEQLPNLVGRVITSDRTHLVEGYACNINGLAFVRTTTATVNPGDNIAILSADAGG